MIQKKNENKGVGKGTPSKYKQQSCIQDCGIRQDLIHDDKDYIPL